MYSQIVVEIDDLGLEYNEILVVAQTGFYIDFAISTADSWKCEGFHLENNIFIFNGFEYCFNFEIVSNQEIVNIYVADLVLNHNLILKIYKIIDIKDLLKFSL